MLRQFLNEVDAVLQNLLDGKRFTKYQPSEPLAANEKKVGAIKDTWRKAMYIAFQIRCAAIEQLMSAPGAQTDADQRKRLADEKSTLAAIVFGELRSIFGHGVIGVRRNWVVAAMASNAKTKKKPKRRGMLGPKDYHPGNLATCGNLACKTCYPEQKIPLPPRPSGDRIVTA